MVVGTRVLRLGGLLLPVVAATFAFIPSRASACTATTTVRDGVQVVDVVCQPGDPAVAPFFTRVGGFPDGNGADTFTMSGSLITEAAATTPEIIGVGFLDRSLGIIEMLGGNDVVVISGGTVGTTAQPIGISLGAGTDTFTMSGGRITGSVFGLGGGNTLTVSGGQIDGSLFPGSQNDTVSISGTAFIQGDATIGSDAVGLEGGNDIFNMSGGTLGGAVSGGDGNDVLTISGGSVGDFVFGNAGTDRVTISGGSIAGTVDAETVIVTGGTIGGDVFNTLVFDMRGGTIEGGVGGSTGNDVLTISAGTINSFVAGSGGTDEITISGGSIAGDVDAETVIVTGGTIGGDVFNTLIFDMSGGSIAGGVNAETVTLTGGTIGGDITGITGNTLIINDAASPAPLVLQDGVLFSGTNAVATITDTDLAAGGANTQVFQGFDSVALDNSTLGFGTGTLGIDVLSLANGSTLFVNGNVIMGGPAVSVANSTITMIDGAADDVFTLGGLAIDNGVIGVDVNQQTIAADQLAAGSVTGTGVNVINVNLLGAPVFTGQTDIPIITTGGPVTGTFIAAGLPGTQGALFTYEILQGPGGLFIRATPANVGLALATQNAADVSTIETAIDALYGINDDAIEFDLGLGNGPAMAALSDTFGVFASGQFAHTEHDGFDMSTGGIGGTGPGFDANDFSAAISIDFNAAKHFGFEERYGLNLGLFGGYASTDVSLEDFAGFIDTGDADNKSAMVGGYGLFRKEFNYVLISGTAFLGETDIFNGVLDTNGSYGTEGYAVTGSVGHIFVLSERTRFDLRGGVLGVTFNGDDYTDDGGNQYGGSEISFGALKFEPGFYADFQLENGMTLSPYARADLQQRFGYSNTAGIGGAEIEFDDSDFSAALSGGFNLKMSQTATMSGEVRGKLSSDSATIGGKLGVKVAF